MYAPKSIDHIHDVLSAVLRTAVKWGHLQENPARRVDRAEAQDNWSPTGRAGGAIAPRMCNSDGLTEGIQIRAASRSLTGRCRRKVHVHGQEAAEGEAPLVRLRQEIGPIGLLPPIGSIAHDSAGVQDGSASFLPRKRGRKGPKTRSGAAR